MATNILSTGVSALTANQTALSYVGQNIANVNTEGYTRQTVIFGTQDAPLLGVTVKEIKRETDQFLISQVWTDTSTFSSNEAYSQKIQLLDNLLVSDSTSLSSAMDSYFASLQTVVDDPLYIANRELFLAEAKNLSTTFTNFDTKLKGQVDLINNEIASLTHTVNAITKNIADLNVQISSMVSSGQSPNTLLDRRDMLVKDLSQYMSVQVVAQDGVQYNVLTGGGQPLVIGSSALDLNIRNSKEDPTKLDIYLTKPNGVDSLVTDKLGTGVIGGLIQYRDEVLQPTINEVGRLAVVFSTTMNEQHRKGMDLNGDFGQDLFTSIRSGEAVGHVDNRSKAGAAVSFYDVSELTASDYKVQITALDQSGKKTFEITRLSDGEKFLSSDLNAVGDLASLQQGGDYFIDANGKISVNFDGVRLSIDGAAAIGDRYLVKPTRGAAEQLDVKINNPRLLALASPLRVEPATTNTGNAELVSVEIANTLNSSDLRRGLSTFPLELVFNAPDPVTGEITYIVNDPANANNPNYPVTGTYVSGEPISFGDYQITLKNQPNPGDRFTIERNDGGFSDSSNALAMSDLQNKRLVNGFSFQDTYGQMLAWVGTKASNAEIAYSSSKSILEASENALQSVAGVNLDEEAANLIKYQQAYQAAAQMLSAYQKTFETLIGAMG